MALGKLDFKATQDKWTQHWPASLYAFKGDSKHEEFIIDSPPPFPTGEFHIGHVLGWCYIDFAARFKRMNGFDVLFPQGWDCHGFPTEVKVEQKYGKNLPRKEFYAKCLEWTHDVVASMKSQMHELGLSIDWKHEYYTIKDDYKKRVQLSLLQMHDKGLVYRGTAPVLWCTYCQSAIAKAETEEKESETLLNYIPFKTSQGELIIATTRPELMHACVGVAVHPGDERHKNLINETIETALGKKVKVITDVDVDKDFGSGAVMICSFGDKQDVLWINRHKLQTIEAMGEDGKIMNSELLGGLYAKEGRAKILEYLMEKGLVLKQEKTKQVVKIHDRCKKPIELLESKQWFIRLPDDKESLKTMGNKIYWYPAYYHQVFDDWINGLEWDWCISRQRVFGIPLPFYYCESCGKTFAAKEKDLPIDPAGETLRKCESCGGSIVGEKSICDGWIDSSLTPLIITNWPNDNYKDHYPVALRAQGSDIIRTWAFYTIYRCSELTGEVPFKEILVNGMVIGNDGKKMSKSLGNYVEAKDVLKQYGADALRQWAALSGTTGKDNAFRMQDVQYAQSFVNKIWNAAKFVEFATPDYNAKATEKHEKTIVDKWIVSRLNQTIKKVTDSMKEYDYYGALTTLQSFFWHDYCDYYLEDVKYRIYDEKNKQAAQETLILVLEETLKMLAPFAPFVTEEIYSQRRKESIHATEWPAYSEENVDAHALATVQDYHAVVSLVRQFKAKNNTSLAAAIERVEITAPEAMLKNLADVEEELKGVLKAKTITYAEGSALDVKVHLNA